MGTDGQAAPASPRLDPYCHLRVAGLAENGSQAQSGIAGIPQAAQTTARQKRLSAWEYPLLTGQAMAELTRTTRQPAVSRHAERARSLARLLDRAVQVPGTRIGFGLDGLLGLIPGFGDAAGGALALYILFLAWRAGVPGPVLARMAGNVGIDVLFGTVPLLGDLADFAFKSNLRNVELLDRALGEPEKARRSSVGWLVVAVVIVALVLLGVVALVIAGIAAVASLL